MTNTTSSDPLIGRVLDGRYEILSRLARGGMATVYRARDLRLGRIIAVKIMHEGLGDDGDFAKRFDREAKAAAKLAHPNVVAVFDQGDNDGRPYIAMELVDGVTLRHVIAREAPLEPLKALDYIEPVVAALAAAHEAGLVHRDIKPENVLISNAGEIKVADFGLAKAVTAQTATQGILIGTVSYLPPELVTTGKADARSDIYSTGVLLFELLTGQKPYVGDTHIQVAYAHVHNDMVAPSTLLAGNDPRSMDSRRIIPPYLDALVQACTRRQASDRPANGRQLLVLVREARKALSHGILDDPKLTKLMAPHSWTTTLSSTPSDPEDTVPTSRVISSTKVDKYGKESRWRPVSASTGPAVSTPPSPVDFSEKANSGIVAVRSQRTPVFPNKVDSPTYRKRRRLVAILTSLLLVALIAGGGVFWWQTEGRFTTAPKLTGLTQEEALSTAQADELTITFSEEYSESVDKGLIVRTDPEAGAKIPKKSQIYAFVSKGPERYPVPEIVGKPLDETKLALVNGNLKVGTVTEEYSETVAAGLVISASEKAGAQVKRDTKVDLVVSLGRKPIPITDYTGQNAETAIAELKDAGFEVTSTEAFSNTVAADLVISQNPNSGTGYAKDPIEVVVSKGPEMVVVPKVGWKSESDAKKALEAAGFQVKVVYQTEEWVRLNIASATSPAGGTKAVKGSTVTLHIV